ncbi:proton channel OTOP2 isoform X2 [Tachysurus fulvidraco]|nr:proton channel OTOP2 isoform X2 [Tachysurus fulvidraco]XP_026997277.1 proton channel OTOP2 isoform X2 [Tachysurus fulvidraco]XP_026997278.1 proton channel OTOP2 isoform X2 [Tachysurus fulvidraco]
MMSTKEELEHRESQISTVQHAGTHVALGTRSASIALSSTGSWRDSSRSWGWLLSGAVLVNVLVLGCALVSGSVFNAQHVTSVHLQLYLVALIVSTTAWMVFYKAYTCRGDEAVLYKDLHAGPVWLRGGLVLFGICSLIMDVFKIAFYVGRVHCDSPVKIVFPAVQAMFILVQTYFLWIHAKDCVQVQRNITRSGLMLTLATNLMIWMMAVTEESLHQTVYPNDTRSFGSRSLSLKASASDGDSSCVCTIAACSVFEEGYYYLYPFNIEYSLFASAMAYVMWKNVGRLVDDHGHHEHRFHMRDVLIGPATGLLVLVAGLTIFVVYEVDVLSDEPGRKDTALIMFYVTNTTTVVLMTVAAAAGCAVYGLEQREHAVGKNPTRTLDVGLLVGASVGQLTVSYFTIVAVIGISVGGLVNALNLAWSVLTIVELCVQNIFIIEGLRREPHQDTRRASIFSNLLALQAHDERRRSSNVLTPRGSIAISVHKPLPWKRKLLKEISSFLLLSNIILWIIPAFGARPQFDNPLGTDFYEFSMWVAVVNIGLPFGIFYRMHSVASLLEVYLTS